MTGVWRRVRPALIGAGLIVGGALVGIGIGAAITAATTPAAPVVSSAPAPGPDSVSPAPNTAAPPPAEPRPEAGPGECVDALGDGGTFDLDRVRVVADGDDLVVTYTLADSATGDGQRSLGITAVARSTSVVLGAQWLDGDLSSVFTAELREGRGRSDVTELDLDRVSVSGREIEVRYPLDALDRLGDAWVWTATAAADPDSDACGEPGIRFGD